MKISIAIPTRSRAIYLRGCLESVLIATDAATCPVEIIVSDNASTDDTQAVIDSFANDRIVYFRQKQRVSMRQNFEDALSKTSGTHVIFIGDDDGILPNGIRVLQEIIEKHQPDIIKWRTLNFIWPNNETQIPGHLEIRPRKLSGRIRQMDAHKVRARFLAGKQRNYNEGGMIYHGCVSRQLIDRVRNLSEETYFWCSMPDVYTSMANVLAAKTDIFRIDRPISIGGASPRSNGDSAKKLAQTGNVADSKEIMAFICEAKEDPFRSSVSDQCMSVELHTLGALELACSLQGIPFTINKKNWRARVEKEIKTFSPKMMPVCEDYFRHVFGTTTTVRETLGAKQEVLVENTCGEKENMTDAPRMLEQRLTKTTVSGGAEMSDIVNAARLLDELVGNADIQKVLNPSFPLIEMRRLQKKLKSLG